MASDFELACSAISDEGTEITPVVLLGLSNAEVAEAQTFAVVIDGLSPARRRELLEMMVERTEETFEVDYHVLFRGILGHPEATVRRLAISGLWEDERADLIRIFSEMLQHDPDISVRSQAATALGKFVWLGEMEGINAKRARQVREALERTLNDREEDIEVVRHAVEAMAFICDDAVRQIIDRAYTHEDPAMRLSAVFAMGRSADPFWNETVLSELDSPSLPMRCEAVRSSGELQLKRAVRRLVEIAAQPDLDARKLAIWALGQIGGRGAEAALTHCLAHGDEEIQKLAAAAIDELQFANMPLDLFVGDLDEEDEEEEDADWLSVGLMQMTDALEDQVDDDDDDDDDGDDDDDDWDAADEDWSDDLIDI